MSPLRVSKRKSLLAEPRKCKEQPDLVARLLLSGRFAKCRRHAGQPTLAVPHRARSLKTIGTFGTWGTVGANTIGKFGFEYRSEKMEARGGIEPPIKVLQTFALPLGDRAPNESSE